MDGRAFGQIMVMAMAAYKTFLIAGPTASGKSRLALQLAEQTGGVILNADSMQVYAGLPVITAQPGKLDLARAPHRLYGHVAPSEVYSTGRWLADIERDMQSISDAPRIIVGGTGLYFNALTRGLAEMPPIDPSLRSDLRAALAAEGAAALHRRLVERDPAMAARLAPADGQRIVRALEVIVQTGHSIAKWQAQTGTGMVNLADPAVQAIMLDPAPALLAAQMERRFHMMMDEGAIDEVRALMAMQLDPQSPAMKAIGVTEIAGWLAGKTSRADAVQAAIIKTRQYAKRQRTWFRNQFGANWLRIDPAGASNVVLKSGDK
jgi:tRNA dimethylallyltransferase